MCLLKIPSALIGGREHCRAIRVYARAFLAGFLLVWPGGGAIAQFKSLQGTLGGEYERQRYEYTEAQSNYSTYRQVATLGASGYLYNPSLAEFNVFTRFINSNSLIANRLSSSEQHDIHFNFYDLNAELLKATNFPLSFFARRDISSTTVSGDNIPSFSNRILATSIGTRMSANIGQQLPRITVGYDSYSSKSLNPFLPLEQQQRNAQIGLDMAVSKSTDASIDFIHRNRQDFVTDSRYITREVHARSFSRPTATDQISFNSNYWNENQSHSISGNAVWNAQYENGTNNQVASQMRWFQTQYARGIEGELRDQLDLPLAPQWRGMVIVAHTEGASSSATQQYPVQSTTLTGGTTLLKEFEQYSTNLSSQVTYFSSNSMTSFQSIDGTVSGGVHTKGFSFGQVTVGEQINLRRVYSSNAQTVLQNTLSLTVESNAIPAVFLHGNTSYLYTGTLAETPLPFSERNLNWMLDLTYRWIRGINVLLILHEGSTLIWSGTLNRINHNYAATIYIPDILNNVSVQGRIGKTYDPLFGMNEFNYDAGLAYDWRALTLTIRWVGYGMASVNRNDVYVTLSRPFRYEFE